MKTTLKQKLGVGVVALGLAGAVFFGREHWKDYDKKCELERNHPLFFFQLENQNIEPKLEKEYDKVLRDGFVSVGLYTASIATIYGGATLVLLDRLKKEWRK